jgi:hypothetical protein
VPAAIRIALTGSSLVYVATAVVARSRTCSAADLTVSFALPMAQLAASPILLPGVRAYASLAFCSC